VLHLFVDTFFEVGMVEKIVSCARITTGNTSDSLGYMSL